LSETLTDGCNELRASMCVIEGHVSVKT
jgi:hypothetical protein